MAESVVDDELWEDFHRVVNMSSRELDERREDLEPTAGEAHWRHRLMTIGHDPLEPASRRRRSGDAGEPCRVRAALPSRCWAHPVSQCNRNDGSRVSPSYVGRWVGSGPGVVAVASDAEDQFAAFFDAGFGRTLACVYALTGDRAEAEDIAQEAYVRAWPRWRTLQTYDDPGAWVRQGQRRASPTCATSPLRTWL